LKKGILCIVFLLQIQFAMAAYATPFEMLTTCFEKNNLSACIISFADVVELSIGNTRTTDKKKIAISDINSFLVKNKVESFTILSSKKYDSNNDILAIAELKCKQKKYKVLITANANEMIHSISIQ
jgi:hypothetical protein